MYWLRRVYDRNNVIVVVVLSAIAAPSLVWQGFSPEPERWKNKQTEGLIAFVAKHL